MSSKKIVVVSDLQQPEAWGLKREGSSYQPSGGLPLLSLLDTILNEQPDILVLTGIAPHPDGIPGGYDPYKQPKIVQPFWDALTRKHYEKGLFHTEIYSLAGGVETTRLEDLLCDESPPPEIANHVVRVPTPTFIPQENYALLFIPGSRISSLPSNERFKSQGYVFSDYGTTPHIRQSDYGNAQVIPYESISRLIQKAQEKYPREEYPSLWENLIVISYESPSLSLKDGGDPSLGQLLRRIKPKAWITGKHLSQAVPIHEERTVKPNTPVRSLFVTNQAREADNERLTSSYLVVNINPGEGFVSYDWKEAPLHAAPPPEKAGYTPITIRYTLHS